MNARLRPRIAPIFPPVIISDAITSVYSVIAVWMPVTVVSRSFATVAIDTFITDASRIITNCAAASVTSTAFAATALDWVSVMIVPLRTASPRRTYWRAMATRRRSSGSMKWSWSSSPRSICTQWILPVKRLRLGRVVGGHGGAGLVADVGRLVGGEDHRLGGLDPAGADRGAVVVQRDVAALGEPAAVVGELHAHLVRAGRDRRRRPRSANSWMPSTL